MLKRLLLPGTALTIANVLLVGAWIGLHVGDAKARRDLPDPSATVATHLIVTTGDVLMFPSSILWLVIKGQRFPDSADAMFVNSPIWGFGLAYLWRRRGRR